MASKARKDDFTIKASIARHLAFAPVAFAVTEGPAHTLLYANEMFRRLQSGGKIGIRAPTGHVPPATADLAPLLDRVFRTAETVRDALVVPLDATAASWSCTIWPVTGTNEVPATLVIEVRDVALIESTKARQRAITEKLLLGALNEQDIARNAVRASDQAHYLAKAARELSMSLDETTTRETVRHLALPRAGTWCIVDVVESNGAIHRLAVVHPDPAKQGLARKLEEQWPTRKDEGAAGAAGEPGGVTGLLRSVRPTVLTEESGAALMLAAHGEENLGILREIGFGSLLVVPLIVRARVQGAITFISREGDASFTDDETALAVDLAARCAMALDNARLYREADALRLAAEAANQSKTAFLGSMSHELRTPLNAIGGFAELMELGIQGPVSEEQHVSLARIKANQEHLLALITEILNFVRIESGRMEYKFAEVSVQQALTDSAEMLSSAIAEKGLIIVRLPCEASTVAWADLDRVRQILVNLVINAVKYTAKGGTITLSCSVTEDTVSAAVADTGAGIPPEKLESIFEPFVQLTAGYKDRRGGVGLGLAISRDLAAAMDGDLTVESTVDVGSRFTLTLPLAKPRSGKP